MVQFPDGSINSIPDWYGDLLGEIQTEVILYGRCNITKLLQDKGIDI